jgi:hypothetical protein
MYVLYSSNSSPLYSSSPPSSHGFSTVGADGLDVASERQISTEKFVFINRKTEKIIKTGMSILCILALSSTFSIERDRRPFINYEFLKCFFSVEDILLCLN